MANLANLANLLKIKIDSFLAKFITFYSKKILSNLLKIKIESYIILTIIYIYNIL